MDFSDVYGTKASTTHTAALVIGKPAWSESVRRQRHGGTCSAAAPATATADSPSTTSAGVRDAVFSAAPTAAPKTDVPGHLGKWHLHPDSHMQRTQRHSNPLQPSYRVHGRDVGLPAGIGQVRGAGIALQSPGNLLVCIVLSSHACSLQSACVQSGEARSEQPCSFAKQRRSRALGASTSVGALPSSPGLLDAVNAAAAQDNHVCRLCAAFQ